MKNGTGHTSMKKCQWGSIGLMWAILSAAGCGGPMPKSAAYVHGLGVSHIYDTLFHFVAMPAVWLYPWAEWDQNAWQQVP